MNQSVGKVLKSRAKSQGLTQAELAKIAKVSIPTMKRWLSGKGLDLEHLETLLKILGLSLGELASDLDARKTQEVELSTQQEKAFVQDPSLLAYLTQLLKGHAPLKIKKVFSLSDSRSAFLLKSLENLGLLERHPHGKIKLLIYGQLRWKTNGPLAKALKRRALVDFLDESRLPSIRLGMHEINADDCKHLEGMLLDLQDFARTAESRALAFPDQPVDIGILAGMAPFRWKVLETID